jgi:hypothetical protein
MTDDQILEVVQAHKEGKKIQGRLLGSCPLYLNGIDDKWVDLISGVDWNFKETEYRVAPEPRKLREWWISPITPVGFTKPSTTAHPINHDYAPSGHVRVREVIEPHRDQRTWWAEFPSDGSMGRIFTDLTQNTKGGTLVRVMEVLD